MAHAIVVHEPGGPEKLTLEEYAPGTPGPGEVLVKQHTIGVNFIDIYYRTGFYRASGLPFIPGQEASGEIISVGPGVTDFRPGDRVAYGTGPTGSYASERVVHTDFLVKLPDAIDHATAAAMMLKGLTARYLLRSVTKIEPSSTILFHAAAGGVGLIACQWAKSLGATVIGTAGSDAKTMLAWKNGCAHVINYQTENFMARVREITNGKGVDVVYDSVGRDTFPGSLDCLRPRGLLVSFGQSSGAVPPFDILQLMARGSLFLTRPSINAYVGTPAELREAAADLFGVVASGAVKVAAGRQYPLAEAARAHADLESRATTGSVVLVV